MKFEGKCSQQNRSSHERRKTACSLRKQGQDTINPQDHDPKQFRFLVYCFSNNISQYYGKIHKNLLGQLDDIYKILISKQQKQHQEDNLLSIIDRCASKLARDIFMRNNAISKNINQYSQQYRKYNKLQDTAQQRLMLEQNTIQLEQYNKTQSPTKNFYTTYTQNIQNISKRTQQSKYKEYKKQLLIKARPYSSNRYHNKMVLSREKDMIFQNRNAPMPYMHNFVYSDNYGQKQSQNQQGTCYVYIRQNCKRNNTGKNKNNCMTRNMQRVKNNMINSELFGIFSEHDFQQFGPQTENISTIQNHSDIATYRVSQKQISHPKTHHNCPSNVCERQNQRLCDYSCSYSTTFSSTACNRQYNSNKFFCIDYASQIKSKSIQEMEKQKIQQRISSMNGMLSTSLIKGHGYKPKSKCWGLTLINNGNLKSQYTHSSKKPQVKNSGGPGKLLISMTRYKQ